MTFQVFLLIFLLFTIQPPSTYAQQSNTRFEFDLKNFSGILGRRDSTTIVHGLKKYLMYLGYLDPNNLNDGKNYDQYIEQAIKKYQEFYRLNVTGVIDINTITSIRKPRCGFPDIFSPRTHFKSLFGFYPDNPRWGRTTLRYYITETTPKAYRRAILQGFREWQRVSPFTFPEVKFHRAGNAFPDITIGFETGEHGDDKPFSYENPTVAHAFQPPIGKVHFNGALRWASDGDPRAIDIETTALHEYGHMLGLEHSTVPEAVMHPHIDYGDIKRRLHEDDVQGIKTLYGF